MNDWTPIIQRGYWDFPRVFIAWYAGRQLLFVSAFDEALDDYTPEFAVYELPRILESELPGNWMTLIPKALCRIGSVPASRAIFDQATQKAVRTSILRGLVDVGTPSFQSSNLSPATSAV